MQRLHLSLPLAGAGGGLFLLERYLRALQPAPATGSGSGAKTLTTAITPSPAPAALCALLTLSFGLAEAVRLALQCLVTDLRGGTPGVV